MNFLISVTILLQLSAHAFVGDTASFILSPGPKLNDTRSIIRGNIVYKAGTLPKNTTAILLLKETTILTALISQEGNFQFLGNFKPGNYQVQIKGISGCIKEIQIPLQKEVRMMCEK